MAHGLLISDHPFLSDLLKVNLQSYLSCKTVIVKNLATFSQLVSIDQSYDFILSLTTLEKTDVVSAVQKVHLQHIANCPLIFLGHAINMPQGQLHVTDPFELATILRTIIKALSWTSKNLMDQPMPEYIPIPMSLIEETSAAFEDLFWKPNATNDSYTKAAAKDDILKDKILLWKQNKIIELYIK